MKMKDAVSSVFNQYSSFQGRARRSEYWYFWLFNSLATLAIGMVGGLLAGLFGSESLASTLESLYSLFVLLPSIAVTVRRLHDTGKSGLYLLWALLPLIGGVMIFIRLCRAGDPDSNDYGPNPKAESIIL